MNQGRALLGGTSSKQNLYEEKMILSCRWLRFLVPPTRPASIYYTSWPSGIAFLLSKAAMFFLHPSLTPSPPHHHLLSSQAFLESLLLSALKELRVGTSHACGARVFESHTHDQIH